MKYFRHYNGHPNLSRNEYTIFGCYAETAAQAEERLYYLLYEKPWREDEGPIDPDAFFEYIDERELYEGEEVVNEVYGFAPIDGTDPAQYSETPDLTIKF